MCGESGGILGMDADCVIEKMKTRVPNKFKAASGECVADGVIFTLNTSTNKVEDIQRIRF
jgi:calcineurin-like phosphoesterase